MSVSRHHADWLNLVEHSGPFFSLPVLCQVFSSGLDQRDAAQAKRLREAYEVWQDNPTAPGQQHAWVMHVLRDLLGYPEKLIAEGQSIPPGLDARMAEMGETLRPELVLLIPQGREGAGQAQMLISIYPPEQKLDKPVTGKHWKATPATRMMELLHGAGVALGLVTNGEHWMLVYAPRGETTGYASWYASLWLDEPITLRAFHSLLCTHRFFSVAEENTPLGMLRESANDQQEVTDQLGYQVREAVEVLVQSFDTLDKESGRKLLYGVEETTLYDASLTVMMRLVFLFSAEERGMLQLGKPLYDNNYALSTLQEQLQEVADRYGEEVLERRTDAWARLLATFRAVHGGVRHQDLSMPAYGGSLFDPDRYPFLEGRSIGSSWKSTAAEPLAINNRVVLHLLNALQRLRVKGAVAGGMAETRRVSFRALGVEQIGHVYEGLLDHTAVCASEPVLGLKGTSKKEPEIPLATLEALQSQGEDKLIAYLKEETGRSPSALKKLLAGSSLLDEHKLLIACGQDHGLLNRIRPFAGLIREDSFERPMIVLPGSVYVTAGTTRRSTGTHYTPPSLTEPVVRHTLEPLVYQGPAEGWPREQWKLKTPKEILELKVCDMAMGSGAFLVQACRYLAERLVEAWENEEQQHPNEVLITPEGGFSKGEPSERLVPVEAEERLAVARRVVADRCLYGVDINPMAVEMAKLSLWLITMDPKRPFSFLDHAFKCGDSLLGIVSTEDLDLFYIDPITGQQRLSGCAELFSELASLRIGLEILPSETLQDIEQKASILKEAEARTKKTKILADTISGARISHATPKARLSYLNKISLSDFASLELKARQLLEKNNPLHWALEFPEVMRKGGFNAFIGNPPFLGGHKISGALGGKIREFMVEFLSHGARGHADLCAYFFIQASKLIRQGGAIGFVATNTIREGDTREVGLDKIISSGFVIFRATSTEKWPGSASLEVSHVWLYKGSWKGHIKLDEKDVTHIDGFLREGSTETRKPHRLLENKERSFQGSKPYGKGFILTHEEASRLIKKNPENAKVIFPYLIGDDLNSRPDQSPSRFVINFFDWEKERAQKYEDCWSIIEERVKPERQRLDKSGKYVVRAPMPQLYWIYGEKRPALYAAIAGHPEVLVVTQVSKFHSFEFVPNGYVYDQRLIVLVVRGYSDFSVLQSSIYSVWINIFGSTLETRPVFTPTDCFDTFPFPGVCSELESAGKEYRAFRCGLMRGMGIGLTELYNLLHNKEFSSIEIKEFRALQRRLDNSVINAYGWSDIRLDHDFYETKNGPRYTISEKVWNEVFDRLLALNHQRHSEEVAAGLHEKKSAKAAGTGKRGRKPAQASPQYDMFSAQAGLVDRPETPRATQTVAASGDDALLSWLQQNPDWHGKEAILSGSGYPENRWNQGIKALLDSGRVERMGERRGARYRIKQ